MRNLYRREISRRDMLRAMAAALAAVPLAACAPKTTVQMAPLSDFPAVVQNSAAVTREAYQYARANPAVLKHIPCYCGCGGIGHTSNYDCYIKEDAGGKLVIAEHGLGCQICVDITQDAMRLLSQGKSVALIKAEIDKTYSQYGPSNMTE